MRDAELFTIRGPFINIIIWCSEFNFISIGIIVIVAAMIDSLEQIKRDACACNGREHAVG